MRIKLIIFVFTGWQQTYYSTLLTKQFKVFPDSNATKGKSTYSRDLMYKESQSQSFKSQSRMKTIIKCNYD